MRILNIGIIGAGNIANNHAEAAENIPEIKLQCVADIVFQRAKDLGDKFKIRSYTDYREMLDRERLDAVVVTLPVFLHCEAVMEAASRKIHILVEKPMASNVDECNQMILEAKKNNVKLMVGHIQRYIPVNNRALQIAGEYNLGQLIMINEKRYYDYFSETRPRWCLKKETSGGGVMLNLGAHSVDKALFMSKSQIKNVAGKVGFFAKGSDVEGNGQLFLEMNNGISAVSTHMGYSKVAEALTEYIFTDGIIKISGKQRITIQTGDCIWEEEALIGKPFELLLEEFYNSIVEDRHPLISGEYGLEIIKAITSLY